MLRLIQGDVGSGKTAVAAWALAAAALGGTAGGDARADRPARAPAPRDADRRCSRTSGLPITLLTGSLSGEGRRNATEAIASGQAAIVVGTHALLQEKVSFADLALAVVDEQHRFGVEQRGALEAKATRGAPHVLLMTATPIPRTLGQVLYADLDVSTLRTPPAGPRADPHGDPPAGRPRRHLGPRPDRGGAGPPDVRGRAADRGRATASRPTAKTAATAARATTTCPTRTWRPRGPPRPRSSSSA